MRLRLRLLQGATALLYMGPLLAGLSGYGWLMLVPFLSIFVGWLILLRPHQWPQQAADWLHARAWTAALTQVLSQLLLLAVLFGTARGIGGVTGTLPMLHPLLPLALSGLALGLACWLWDADWALARGTTLDELLYPSRPRPPAPRRDRVRTDLTADLLSLPDDIAPQAALGHLDEALDDTDTVAALASLGPVLAADPDRHGGLRAGLVLWASDPDRFANGTAPGAMQAAFAAVGSDPALLRLLVPRAVALARALPDRLTQFPDPARIEALARSPLPPEVAEGLVRLARLLQGPAQPSPFGALLPA